MFHCVLGIFRVGVASAPRALVMRCGARPLLAHASSLAITVARDHGRARATTVNRVDLRAALGLAAGVAALVGQPEKSECAPKNSRKAPAAQGAGVTAAT